MKGVQCYELFGGIALKIHTFSFFFIGGSVVRSSMKIFEQLYLIGRRDRNRLDQRRKRSEFISVCKLPTDVR